MEVSYFFTITDMHQIEEKKSSDGKKSGLGGGGQKYNIWKIYNTFLSTFLTFFCSDRAQGAFFTRPTHGKLFLSF